MTLKQTNQTTGSGQYGMKSAVLQSVFIVLAVLLQLIPDAVALGEEREGKTLIIYYSRTGKSKLVCDVLQKNIHADILEVKDTKGRYKPGRTTAVRAFLI